MDEIQVNIERIDSYLQNDYNELLNLPSINNKIIEGNQDSSYYDLAKNSDLEIINETIDNLEQEISNVNKKIPVIRDESYNISTSTWIENTTISPYKYEANIGTIDFEENLLKDTTEVTILNDQPILFATYAFVIGKVEQLNSFNRGLTFYAIDKPTSDVTLKVRYKD